MNDVMEQIKTLSATLDEETTRFHPTGKLLLLGSYESVFLKAVKRKADLLGIDCDLTQYPCPPYKAVVVDRETVPSDIMVKNNLNVTAVANTLSMQRNTVLYHLDKIERETKLNPRHIHDLIDLLEIALEVL